jgi:hypothetical protein
MNFIYIINDLANLFHLHFIYCLIIKMNIYNENKKQYLISYFLLVISKPDFFDTRS